jgi:hypothetical protein
MPRARTEFPDASGKATGFRRRGSNVAVNDEES